MIDDNPCVTDGPADEDFFDSVMQLALAQPGPQAVARIVEQMTLEEGIARLRPIAVYNPYAAELLAALLTK